MRNASKVDIYLVESILESDVTLVLICVKASVGVFQFVIVMFRSYRRLTKVMLFLLCLVQQFASVCSSLIAVSIISSISHRPPCVLEQSNVCGAYMGIYWIGLLGE